jgi:hypothetical protein
MPKEYEHCKESYLKKGVSEKKAKAICSGMYYNRNGVTVKEAHKRGLKSMLYFSRTKEALKTYLTLEFGNVNDFVIVRVPKQMRDHTTLKSLFPKLQNTEYNYVAISKSAVDVSTDGNVILSIEKIIKETKENQTSEQNKENVAHTEGAYSAVKDGKLTNKESCDYKSGELQEEIKHTPIMTQKSVNSSEGMNSVFEKLREGKKLMKDEKAMLHGYLEAKMSLGALTKEEMDSIVDMLDKDEEMDKSLLEKIEGKVQNEPVEEGAVIIEMQDNDKNEKENMGMEPMETETMTSEENNPEEEKALTATTSTSESMEHEDMENPMALTKSMLSAHNSVSKNEPIFEIRQEAQKFARQFNLKYSDRVGKKAVVKSTSVEQKRKFGNKAKFFVEFE